MYIVMDFDWGAYAGERDFDVDAEDVAGSDSGKSKDYGSEAEEYPETKADYADTQRTAKGTVGEGTVVGDSKLRFAQQRSKTPAQRFAESFASKFRLYDDDQSYIDAANTILTNIDRVEYLSPTYAAAAIYFVFQKQKGGVKYIPMNPSDKKLLETFTKQELNPIDMVRYIRIIERAMK